MFPLRLLPVVATLTFAHAAFAADAQPQSGAQPACGAAAQDNGQHAQRRADDADIDGSGACRLVDGYVAAASRPNGGVSPGALGGADDAAPGRHRFGDEEDIHALRGGHRVTTIDMSTTGQRAGLDMTGTRAGTDLFRQVATLAPVYWDTALPGYVGGGAAALDADHYTSVAVPDEFNAATPGLGGGPLTARSGRALAPGADATSPAPVPEPTTWAMLAAGFGVLLLRRRSA